MIVAGVDLSARQAAGSADAEAVGLLLDLGTHPAEPVRERRDAVALLDAELLRTADRDAAAVGGKGSEHRQFIDDAGNLFGGNHEVPKPAVADSQRANRLPAAPPRGGGPG